MGTKIKLDKEFRKATGNLVINRILYSRAKDIKEREYLKQQHHRIQGRIRNITDSYEKRNRR